MTVSSEEQALLSELGAALHGAALTVEIAVQLAIGLLLATLLFRRRPANGNGVNQERSRDRTTPS